MPAFPSQIQASQTTSPEEDTEEPDDIPTALCQFMQEHDELELISNYFDTKFNQKVYVIILRVLKEVSSLIEPKKTSIAEFLDLYRRKTTEFCDALRDEARLSALLLPSSIREDLLRDLLEDIDYICENYLTYDLDRLEHYLDFVLEPKGKEVAYDHPQPGTSTPKTTKTSLINATAPEKPIRPDQHTPAICVAPGQRKIQEGCHKDADHGLEPRELRRGNLRRIWNHLTISRDKTSASDFAEQILSILCSSKQHIGDHNGTQAENNPASKAATLAPEQLQQLVQQQQNIFHKDPRQNHLLLADQSSRLYRLLHKISSQGNLRKLPDARNNMEGLLVSGLESKAEILLLHQTFSNLSDKEICTEKKPTSTQHTDQASSVKQNGPSNEHDELLSRIASLEAENISLKAQEIVAREQTLNFILADNGAPSMAYLDEPNWVIGPKGEIILTAHFPITDINGFLRQKHDIAFVVSKYYSPKDQEAEVQSASRAKQALPRPKPSREVLTFQSKEMIDAAEEFFARRPNFAEEFPNFNIRGHIAAPYLFWYHYRGPDAIRGLTPVHERLMRLVATWIEDNYGGKYDLVDKQLDRGVISQDTVPFLFKPGDVIVWEKRGELHAAIAQSWLEQISASRLSWEKKERDWLKASLDQEKTLVKWKVESWRYEYDGKFLHKKQSLEIECSAASTDEEISISKLNAYPLKHAPPKLKATLENRGKTFWSCRHQNLVSYEDEKGVYGSGERFVVDFQTYQQIHYSSGNFKLLYPNIDDQDCQRMEPEVMALDEPPSAPEIYIFPNTIPGYDLKSKKWVDLDVDMIREVTWNKKSFEHLVVDPETKELIQALVIRQIASEQGTDIIDRKGNGLIILLHGGPGTGKTFTAESVAEMAEKPLFRVTCGDIGTKPEDVEKYLESVLHLGKTWGCVVLIDEAEVFLEQRSLDNLERNALVSVFLRVLEYYEGILILTSNRVGTFDEAFKSRILLSLHYENLTKGQRTKIWKNFISRLKDMDDDGKSLVSSVTELGSRKRKFQEKATGIDFDDVECYFDELANYELNGRQIRNVITTARQLATFRDERMSFKHLTHVINVSSKFDKYLKTVQEGYSDDQIARGDGVR